MKVTGFLAAAMQLICICYADAQNKADSVVYLPMKAELPKDALKLGVIKTGNNSTATSCDYEALVNTAKEKAAAIGGNIVKVAELIPPAFISKCYKIVADVYYTAAPGYKAPAANNALAKATTNQPFALLCIYRFGDTLAFQGAYDLHMDKDSLLCKVKSKSCDSVKIYNAGHITLWAKTEKRTELKLDVKTGHTYYIRCGLAKGEIRMNPVLELIDESQGAREFAGNNKKKKDIDVSYLYQVH